MRIFVTGATGFIGGSVAAGFVADGHEVRGLCRSEAQGDGLRRMGVAPVPGTLDDAALLAAEAARADAVVSAASSDHRPSVEALLGGLQGSGKVLIHTSGSSIVADDARGEYSDAVYDEDSLPVPTGAKAARVAIDTLVRDAAQRGVRSVVVCNTLIYGEGRGLHRDSIQVPSLVAQALASGVVRHVGAGRNVWSNVHVDDVVDLYRLALTAAEPGAFLFAENGELSFREVAAAIGEALGISRVEAWPAEDAVREWGEERALYALGSNSRVRGRRSRALGWRPRHDAPLVDIGEDARRLRG